MAYSSPIRSCEISASLASGAARRVVLLRRLCGATSAVAQVAKVATRHIWRPRLWWPSFELKCRSLIG